MKPFSYVFVYLNKGALSTLVKKKKKIRVWNWLTRNKISPVWLYVTYLSLKRNKLLYVKISWLIWKDTSEQQEFKNLVDFTFLECVYCSGFF